MVLAAAALCAACGGGGSSSDPQEPPSIVLVMIDTVRADSLTHHGYSASTSPNIARWAERGTHFSNAVAASPWTGPSVASIVTGAYPDELGIHELEDPLPRAATTLAEVLNDHGYSTAAVVSNGYISEWFGHSQGYDFFHQEEYTGADDNFTPVCTADRVTDRALEWLREAKPPFFLYVHYTDPHDPYLPPATWRERFVRHPGSIDLRLMEQQAFTQARLTKRQVETIRQIYEAEIAFTDYEIGRLLKATSPQEIVVIVGDHGEEFLDHGGFLHGHTLFQEMLHVPLLFAGPGVHRANVVDEPVSHVDIAPTILDLAGLPQLEDSSGRSLIDRLQRSERADDPRDLFAVREYGGIKAVAARRGSWKMIYVEQTGQQALFDLSRDPNEKENLLHEHASLAHELRTAIDGRRDRIRETPPLDDEELERKRLQKLRNLGYIK
jgi:arylsulfatase A-like enzyme